MPPAARVTDPHVCPMVTGIVPHVGGPILPPGCPTVMIGFLPAARVSDMATCVGPPDVIVKGSPTVLIGNLLAARMLDNTAHGGMIVMGCPTVIIGEMGMGSMISPSMLGAIAGKIAGSFSSSAAAAGAAAGAAAAGSASYSAGVASAAVGAAAGAFPPPPAGGSTSRGADSPPEPEKKLSWYKAKVLNPDGTPAPNLPFRLELPDGDEYESSTDSDGMIKVGGIPPGQCQLRLLSVDKTLWKRK